MLILRIGILALVAFSVSSCATSGRINGAAGMTAPKLIYEPAAPPKEILATESVDPAWSEEAESQLRQSLEELLDTTVFVPEIECRSTMCGVAFHLDKGAHLKGTLGLHLAEAVRLTRSEAYALRRSDGTQIVAFYLMP